MIAYVVAADKEEAWQRWTACLYVKDETTAKQLAGERTDQDECTPQCQYKAWRVVTKTVMEEL